MPLSPTKLTELGIDPAVFSAATAGNDRLELILQKLQVPTPAAPAAAGPVPVPPLSPQLISARFKALGPVVTSEHIGSPRETKAYLTPGDFNMVGATLSGKAGSKKVEIEDKKAAPFFNPIVGGPATVWVEAFGCNLEELATACGYAADCNAFCQRLGYTNFVAFRDLVTQKSGKVEFQMKTEEKGGVSTAEVVSGYVAANIYRNIAEDQKSAQFQPNDELAPRVYLVYDEKNGTFSSASKHLIGSKTLDEHLLGATVAAAGGHVRVVDDEAKGGSGTDRPISKNHAVPALSDKQQLADALVAGAIMGYSPKPENMVVVSRRERSDNTTYNAVAMVGLGNALLGPKPKLGGNHFLDHFNQNGTGSIGSNYPGMIPSKEMINALKKAKAHAVAIQTGVRESVDGLQTLTNKMADDLVTALAVAPPRTPQAELKIANLKQSLKDATQAIVDIHNNYRADGTAARVLTDAHWEAVFRNAAPSHTGAGSAVSIKFLVKTEIDASLGAVKVFCDSSIGVSSTKLDGVISQMELQLEIDDYLKMENKNPSDPASQARFLAEKEAKLAKINVQYKILDDAAHPGIIAPSSPGSSRFSTLSRGKRAALIVTSPITVPVALGVAATGAVAVGTAAAVASPILVPSLLSNQHKPGNLKKKFGALSKGQRAALIATSPITAPVALGVAAAVAPVTVPVMAIKNKASQETRDKEAKKSEEKGGIKWIKSESGPGTGFKGTLSEYMGQRQAELDRRADPTKPSSTGVASLLASTSTIAPNDKGKSFVPKIIDPNPHSVVKLEENRKKIFRCINEEMAGVKPTKTVGTGHEKTLTKALTKEFRQRNGTYPTPDDLKALKAEFVAEFERKKIVANNVITTNNKNPNNFAGLGLQLSNAVKEPNGYFRFEIEDVVKGGPVDIYNKEFDVIGLVAHRRPDPIQKGDTILVKADSEVEARKRIADEGLRKDGDIQVFKKRKLDKIFESHKRLHNTEVRPINRDIHSVMMQKNDKGQYELSDFGQSKSLVSQNQQQAGKGGLSA